MNRKGLAYKFMFPVTMALAALRGREYVLPDDIKELAFPVLGHRLILASGEMLRGTAVASVIEDILHSTRVQPRLR